MAEPLTVSDVDATAPEDPPITVVPTDVFNAPVKVLAAVSNNVPRPNFVSDRGPPR